MFFQPCSENLDDFMFFSIKTDKVQLAIDAFEFVKSQVFWQIIITVDKTMSTGSQHSLNSVDRYIVLTGNAGHGAIFC